MVVLAVFKASVNGIKGNVDVNITMETYNCAILLLSNFTICIRYLGGVMLFQLL
jgi:hypothetical protein